MTRTERSSETVLVTSDNTSNLVLVRNALEAEYENILTSTGTDAAAQQLEHAVPRVIVLAFDTLIKSERYYLEMFRRFSGVLVQPHRAIVLCDKAEVRRAYELCKKGMFDDYVQFWPMTLDPMGLPMAVHNALRTLAYANTTRPSSAEWAAEVSHLGDAAHLFEQRLGEGGSEIEDVGRAMQEATTSIGVALEGFLAQLKSKGGGLESNAQWLDRVTNACGQLTREIASPMDAATRSVDPLRQWAEDFRADCQPYLDSTRKLHGMIEKFRPTILVVDDDPFQRKIVATILQDENFRLVFASDGMETLSVLRRTSADLILIDMLMPGIDGAQTTRLVKAAPHFVHIPVMMMTGESRQDVVAEGIKAGAIDFVVKPLDRATLIERVNRALRSLH